MKTTFIALFALVAMVVLPSCKDGGTGPHPGLELSILDQDGYLYALCGNAFLTGDSVKSIQMPFDTMVVRGGEVRLSILTNKLVYKRLEQFNNEQLASTTISFTEPATKAEGTYAWAQGATPIVAGTGATVSVNGGTYLPVSGQTVITKVYKNANGTVIGYKGYMNGVCSMMSVIPGTTTIVNKNIVVQSCVFDMKNAPQQ
ncbi:MAG: hypothetical protein JSS89_09980 [Bacteroidetes bacterium]|nr:hypothetical protein [Bacteroidota bacterium]